MNESVSRAAFTQWLALAVDWKGLVTWIQSHVRDAARRELLADLDRVAQAMARHAADDHETDLAFKCYANLTRMWAET